MERDLLLKIQKILNRGTEVSEDEVRSLMILVRKRLEFEADATRSQYLTLNLFCNWAAHTKITQSITGLRVLARINDALVKSKNSPGAEVQADVSRAIGLDVLRSEFGLFLHTFGIKHKLSDKRIWAVFLAHLIEIIQDVPLAFPPVSKLQKGARTIYDRIVQNPIEPGAGVVSMKLSRVDYDGLGITGLGQMICLLLKTENKITINIPLEIIL